MVGIGLQARDRDGLHPEFALEAAGKFHPVVRNRHLHGHGRIGIGGDVRSQGARCSYGHVVGPHVVRVGAVVLHTERKNHAVGGIGATTRHVRRIGIVGVGISRLGRNGHRHVAARLVELHLQHAGARVQGFDAQFQRVGHHDIAFGHCEVLQHRPGHIHFFSAGLQLPDVFLLLVDRGPQRQDFLPLALQRIGIGRHFGQQVVQRRLLGHQLVLHFFELLRGRRGKAINGLLLCRHLGAQRIHFSLRRLAAATGGQSGRQCHHQNTLAREQNRLPQSRRTKAACLFQLSARTFRVVRERHCKRPQRLFFQSGGDVDVAQKVALFSPPAAARSRRCCCSSRLRPAVGLAA